jgi:cobalamin biosynthesis Mg chelatase CobN
LIDFYDLRFVEQCPNLAMSVVAFSLRLGGDVSSFTPDVRTEMKTAIAARASVPITAVELAVTPGSVIVGVTIQTPTVTAASVQSAIYSSTSSLANANAMFSSVTGVSITVEEVVTQPTTTAQASGAAQGLTAAGGGGSAGPATGGAIGGAIGGIFVVVLALFGYWRYRNQKMQTKKMENRAQVIKQNKTEMTTKKTTKTRTTTTTTTVDSLDS